MKFYSFIRPHFVLIINFVIFAVGILILGGNAEMLTKDTEDKGKTRVEANVTEIKLLKAQQSTWQGEVLVWLYFKGMKSKIHSKSYS